MKLGLNQYEAAASLGVGLTYFREHVLPELRVVREGRRLIVPARELEAWLDRHAESP